MKLKPQTAILLSIFFVLAGIAITWATGLWHTDSDKIPRKLEAEPVSSQAGHEQYDPADIRGSYTFGEISDLYGIPLNDLVAAFQIVDDQAAAFQVKSLEKQFPDAEKEIGTASVRMFAALYLGLDYPLTEETYLPDTAATVLGKVGRMTAEQVSYISSHSAALNP